jgi:hypothetical protein
MAKLPKRIINKEAKEYQNRKTANRIELEHIRHIKINGIGREKGYPLLLGLCTHRLGVWHGEIV